MRNRSLVDSRISGAIHFSVNLGRRHRLGVLVLALCVVLVLMGCGSSGDGDGTGNTGNIPAGPSLPKFITDDGATFHTMNGTWQGCRADGTGSKLLTVGFVLEQFLSSNAEHDSIRYSTPDCSGTSTGSEFEAGITYSTSGTKSVSWDASGVPAGLGDPITVSLVTITSLFFGTEKAVSVIDDNAATLVWYLKTEVDGGPISADGFPNDISLDGDLTQ